MTPLCVDACMFVFFKGYAVITLPISVEKSTTTLSMESEVSFGKLSNSS